MWRNLLLGAGVFSLILFGSWESARANPAADSQAAWQGDIAVFGTTYCASSAPANLGCHWRAARDAAEQVELTAPSGARVYSLLGFQLCIGEASPGQRCDLRLPASPRSDSSS